MHILPSSTIGGFLLVFARCVFSPTRFLGCRRWRRALVRIGCLKEEEEQEQKEEEQQQQWGLIFHRLHLVVMLIVVVVAAAGAAGAAARLQNQCRCHH